MQLADHYLRLRSRFAAVGEGQPIPVSLQQLADILCCTNRNANLLLKRMAEAQWITWSAGRGRGNLSQLTFLASKESLLYETAQELVQKGEFHQALALLQDASVPPDMKRQFLAWLNGYFGYRSEGTEERQVDTLRFPLPRKRWMLDPAFAIFAHEAQMARQIFDCLVRYSPHTKQIEPQVAHYWEANPDRTEWTFYLRKGVRFHHGRALTAADVAFSLRRMMDPQLESPFHWMFARIQEIETLGSLALKIRLAEPNHLFLHYLGSHPASILPEDLYAKLGQAFARLPVGTGPFQVARHDETALILEAFPDYFQHRAHLDRVEIWMIPDFEQYQAEHPTGHFQMRYFSSQPDSAISPGWQGVEQLQTGCRLLLVNLAKPGPQQHPAFRQALRFCINREKLAAAYDHTISAHCLFPDFEEGAGEEGPDLAQAKKWLQESGYRGEPLRLSVLAHYENWARLIQEQVREIGVQLEIALLPVEDFYAMREVRKADLALCDVVFDDDLAFSFMEFFHTDSSYVRSFLHAEWLRTMDRRIADILREPDSFRQLEKFLQLERKLIEEGVIIPLVRRKQRTYYHPSLKGVSIRSFGWVDFKDIWFHPDHRE
jgi:SgrR family transcriptional regulator